ncbi:lysyl-tRNA synthetase [Shimia sp. SK013]|uniref:phosphatidylglycerol lysyltransferase domain-containing protein n=1 Tax=Shimia sp. SK013 TaxID=1389006 RepID=UPI0006B6800D|nr:phosphatidylglycerol lysyltransferase domain-containing protein [Shimia sp. SK013]KPA22625.1 lysyl-tRNA synthetase [Shimia sp. SK013]
MIPARPKLLRVLSRHALPVLLGGACLWMLSSRLGTFDLAAVWAAVLSVPVGNWMVALLATLLSFLAISRYDVIARRHFQMRHPQREAMLEGATAIAIGQTTGAGAIVGGFVRWRMHPDTSAKDAAKVTGFVTVTFLGTLAVTISLAALALPTPHVPPFLPLVILIAAAVVCLIAFFFPVLNSKNRKLSLPTLSALRTLLALCILDTGFAALAFWMLLPPETALPFATLIPVFLIALGAAIFSGSPGGVGPFELTLIALLPQHPETGLLCAVLAFRAVYYALPALLAAAVLLHRVWQPMRTEHSRSNHTFVPFEASTPSSASRAELGVIRQNGGAILTYATGSCGTVRTGQTLLALFDPVEGNPGAMMPVLRKAARDQNRIACKYKIGARQAVYARKSGWSVAHISDEAVLTPSSHTTDGPTRRQLRRKLRQAQKADVRVCDKTVDLPLQDMARVSALWEDQHGVPRGVTMGRFEEGYIHRQKVFLAYRDGILQGFVSFHATAHEWCLDLMRVLPDAPDGTMHLLVQTAIESAAKTAVPRLSLAAAPAMPTGKPRIERFLRAQFYAYGGGSGLRQFKSSFAPSWQPLFMAAPSASQLTFAAIDVIRAVNLRSAPATPISSTQSDAPVPNANSDTLSLAS